MVGDDVEEIKVVVGEIFVRKFEVFVISGGFGLIYDDVIMLVVVEVLGRKFVFCEKCFERIKVFYEKFYSEGYIDDLSLNEGWKKMVYLLEGVELFESIGGVVFGVFIEYKGVKIFVFLGMLREMKVMFEKEVFLRFGRRKFF